MTARSNAGRSPANIEIFAGAGGLSIGCLEAGFSPGELFEMDEYCCKTLRHNSENPTATIVGRVHEGSVGEVDWSKFGKSPALLTAGAPCQPFSLGGRHLAEKDGRNLFPEVFRAMRALHPRALLLENVRGLMRPGFLPYLRYILAQAHDPSFLPASKTELWQEHYGRIVKHQNERGYRPEYNVAIETINAADFGIPQVRQRVFIVATRSDIPAYAFPKRTHSRAALLRSQDGKMYWESRGMKAPKKIGPRRPHQLDSSNPETQPWVTVRDALQDLPAPARAPAESSNNHWSIPGARGYHGHSGSVLDWPSKTIKAGVHGVPGGENTLIDERGRLRYYTLRETARLQSFPDDHVFVGARIHITRQIGNAVPCKLARAVAKPLFDLLNATSNSRKSAVGKR